jgi:hypothetical protein
MTDTLHLDDTRTLADLRVYLQRAARIDDKAVRLIAGGGTLAAYAPVLYRRGLLDQSPTILGLRTFRCAPIDVFDRTVTPQSMIERIAALDGGERTDIRLTEKDEQAPWSGVSAPRDGWEKIALIDSVLLEHIAREGAAEIAEAVPTGAGDHIVHNVRSAVWSRPVGESPLPGGAAFGAVGLGFLGQPEEISLYRTSNWLRLSSQRGHLLVKL